MYAAAPVNKIYNPVMEVSEGEAVIERAENCFTVGYSTTIDCSN